MHGAARIRVLLLGSVLSGALHGCASEDEKACTLIGCTSGAHLAVITVADAAPLDRATIRVCRNEVCSETLLPAVPTMLAGDSLDVTEPLPVRILVERRTSGVSVSAETYAVGDPTISLRDGDVYTTVLRDRDGVLLSEGAWTATYDASYPNGVGCDPSPCLQARLTPLAPRT